MTIPKNLIIYIATILFIVIITMKGTNVYFMLSKETADKR
jgi:hypothetical protein